jgi:hypothetical protein
MESVPGPDGLNLFKGWLAEPVWPKDNPIKIPVSKFQIESLNPPSAECVYELTTHLMAAWIRLLAVAVLRDGKGCTHRHPLFISCFLSVLFSLLPFNDLSVAAVMVP